MCFLFPEKVLGIVMTYSRNQRSEEESKLHVNGKFLERIWVKVEVWTLVSTNIYEEANDK